MEALEITACRLVIGDLATENLPSVATEALVHEVDSPSLRQLAGLAPGDVREAYDLFRAALDELGLPLPDKDAALWRLTQLVATQIVAGSIAPYEGARWIWTKASHDVAEEGDLRIFVGLASEREDHPDAGAKIDAQIIEAAKELLARAEPRRWLRLQARHGESPLSRWRPEALEPVAEESLDLSPALAAALTSWAKDYDSTFGDDADRSGFPSPGHAEAFVERGRTLAADLQGELGDSWHVEFYQEPTRPPGLRLRAR